MFKESSQQVAPELGEWYHLNAYMLPGANHHLFCLCTKLDADSVILHVRKHEKTEIFKVAIGEVKKAQWIVKNSFHQFCLFKIKQILNDSPSTEELDNNLCFLLCFDLATQFRIYRAKTHNDAIDRAYDVVNKSMKDKLPSYQHELLEQLLREHDEFKRCNSSLQTHGYR
ncbi:MAG: hypothetical protein IJR07_11080 [Bacteroidaceae bacterium]|nr:hypothetical protein [Bacteroidaceae bacterium]